MIDSIDLPCTGEVASCIRSLLHAPESWHTPASAQDTRPNTEQEPVPCEGSQVRLQLRLHSIDGTETCFKVV